MTDGDIFLVVCGGAEEDLPPNLPREKFDFDFGARPTKKDSTDGYLVLIFKFKPNTPNT